MAECFKWGKTSCWKSRSLFLRKITVCSSIIKKNYLNANWLRNVTWQMWVLVFNFLLCPKQTARSVQQRCPKKGSVCTRCLQTRESGTMSWWTEPQLLPSSFRNALGPAAASLQCKVLYTAAWCKASDFRLLQTQHTGHAGRAFGSLLFLNPEVTVKILLGFNPAAGN